MPRALSGLQLSLCGLTTTIHQGDLLIAWRTGWRDTEAKLWVVRIHNFFK